MAKIYLQYIQENELFAKDLASDLQELRHQIVRPDIQSLGKTIDEKFDSILKTSDVLITIISPQALQSKFFSSELFQIKNYTATAMGKLFIPIFWNDEAFKQAPDVIKTVQGIVIDIIEREDVKKLANDIDEAVNLFLGEKIAKRETAEIVKEKIETSAPTYIQETLKELKGRESKLSLFATVWYVLGLLSLLAGIAAAVWLSNSGFKDFGDKENWSRTIFFAIKSALILVLLIAASKYSFTLGKSYMNESLKISDRIHAISFGKFYLQVFNQQLEPNDVKEIFRDWNINNQSAFINQSTNEYDPKILEKAIEVIDKIKDKFTTKDKI